LLQDLGSSENGFPGFEILAVLFVPGFPVLLLTDTTAVVCFGLCHTVVDDGRRIAAAIAALARWFAAASTRRHTVRLRSGG
jgi:hypothetical protein